MKKIKSIFWQPYRSIAGFLSKHSPDQTVHTEFINGLKITSCKQRDYPLAACTIMFQAGSRYERDTTLGASHFLRVGSTCSGVNYSQYIKTRFMQEVGCNITVSSDRETVAYTLRCPSHLFNELKYYLVETAVRCNYNNWELDETIKKMVERELHYRNAEHHVLDLVQRACWAGPLSQSMYCPKGRVNSMSSSTLTNYVAQTCNSSVCSVGSIGVPVGDVVKMAESMFCRDDKPMLFEMCPSWPKGGYEFYDKGKSEDTLIALCVPGCGFCNLKELLKYNILVSACNSCALHRGTHAMDRIELAPLGKLSEAQDLHSRARIFSTSYMETGVFGILIKTKSQYACPVSVGAVQFLTNNIVSMDLKLIEAGKQRLKLDLMINAEEPGNVSEGLAYQGLAGSAVDDPQVVFAEIDAITLEEVLEVAESIVNRRSKMAWAVVGDVTCVPHDGELRVL